MAGKGRRYLTPSVSALEKWEVGCTMNNYACGSSILSLVQMLFSVILWYGNV